MLTKDFVNIRDIVNPGDAVAELLDLVFIFGILAISFGIIGLTGHTALKNAQETRNIENAKQSFIILSERINKIALGRSPSQAMEMKLYGGTLSIQEDSAISINATSGDKEMTLYSDRIGSIRHSIGDTIIAYEGTGAWIKYPSGRILNAYRPLITAQQDTLIIPVVKIGGISGTGGTGMTRIRAEGETGIIVWSNVTNITVTVTGTYVPGWEDYFREMNWETGTGYTARLDSEKNQDVYILITGLYAEIE